MSGPAQPFGRVEIQQYHQIRLEPAGGPAGQPGDLVDRQRPAGLQIRQRRVDVPLADDHRTALQRRSYHGGNVMRAVGRVQQCLGPRCGHPEHPAGQ